MPIPRIIISPGEPAGIGPDITIKIAQAEWPAELVVIGDSDLLAARAEQLKLPLALIPFKADAPPKLHQPQTLICIDVKLAAACKVGHLDSTNSNYVIDVLTQATDLCLTHRYALVTGPIQKSILNEAGIAFSGHTEFLAARSSVKTPIMFFVTENCKVALATTHLPLTKVPAALTTEHLIEIIEILNAELINKFKLNKPKILVCGLNPHAGESGHLGTEEITTIIPAIKFLQKKNIDVIGPLPADTIFTQKYLAQCDAILGMYHDQALPVVKYMSFGHAVNVTLGLPFIRTSVDHGTALDIAGTGTADAGSMAAALKLAIELRLKG